MSYTGSTIQDLNPQTPTEGVSTVAELNDSIRQIKAWIRSPATGGLVDLMYPIGSQFVSFTSNNPSVDIQTRHGLVNPFGTWYKLEGVVTVAHTDGDSDFGTVTPLAANGEAADAGTKTHQLTIPEMPRHRFSFTGDQGTQFFTINDENTVPADTDAFRADGPTGGGDSQWYPYTEYLGNDQAHNNIQPSRTAYVWVRAA